MSSNEADYSISPSPSAAAWEAHEREQILFIARNTTPLQRLQWLEEMLTLLTPYLPRRDRETPAGSEER